MIESTRRATHYLRSNPVPDGDHWRELMSADCSNVADFLLEGKDPNSCALLTIRRKYTYGDMQSGSK